MPMGNYPRPALRDRFEAKVDRTGECHLWTASLCGTGYGQFMVNGRPKLAHRVAWEIDRGPIPPGIAVCHHCDVKLCVRLEHLFLGTQRDNLRDMDRKKRRVNGDHRGRLNGRACLTESQVREVRVSSDSAEDAGLRLGVATSTVRAIRWGKTWRHLL